ncbi:acyl-Coenzyme A binding domain containing 4 [Cricetulus griseus]
MGTEKEEPDCQKQFQAAVSVIQNLPKNGWKEPVLHRDDDQRTPEPSCLPKEPVPPSPESQPPRDLDLEVFCDSLEQLEPELVRPPLLSPIPAVSELSHLYPGTWDSSQQVWAEQRGAPGRELDTRSSPESPSEKEGLEGSLTGPQELDRWLVATVRAMQESMKNVQRRLESLESKAQPCEQRPPRTRPWPLGLSAPALLFFILWPFVAQWLLRQFRTQKRRASRLARNPQSLLGKGWRTQRPGRGPGRPFSSAESGVRGESLTPPRAFGGARGKR